MDILTRDPSEYMALLNARRFAKLKKQIRYCFSNVDYYRQRFLEAGVASKPASTRRRLSTAWTTSAAFRPSSTRLAIGNLSSGPWIATDTLTGCI